MNYTEDQQKAITTRGGKIVIGAAAGSGKTAVLSARVIDFVKQGGQVGNLLIVTFTKLASLEMKERIKKQLLESYQANPENIHLKEEARNIEQADIMTMDSFYQKLLKEYFYLFGIDPNFQIIDEMNLRLLKEETVKQTIEEALKTPSESLYRLLDNFSNPKTGETIEQILIPYADFINKMPFGLSWMEEIPKQYTMDNPKWLHLFKEEYQSIFRYYISLYDDILETNGIDEVISEKLLPFLQREKESLLELYESLKTNDIDGFIKQGQMMSGNKERFPSIKGYTDHELVVKAKEIRAESKKQMSKLDELLPLLEPNNYQKQLEQTRDMLEVLNTLAKTYHTKLWNYMKENNQISFDFVPGLLLSILVQNYNFKDHTYEKTDIAINMMNRYDDILIDEYQDTNFLQDLLFKVISKNDSNLFLVGDVKQSIYGFRSSRPELFIAEQKKSSFEQFPMRIALSKNFRSRDVVLDFTNYLFLKIMNQDYGSITYDEHEKLYLGAQYEENPLTNVEMHIFKGEEKLLSIDRKEKEASFIARKIQSLIQEKYPVYDNRKKSFRPVTFSDITILLRNNDNEIYRNALKNSNIPVYTESSPVYFDHYEVRLLLHLLEAIASPVNDISFVTVLRSPVFMLNEEDLLDIRMIHMQGSFYENLCRSKIIKHQNIIKRFKQYQIKSRTDSLPIFLTWLYQETKLFSLFSNSKESKEASKNLMTMLVHAENYERNNPNGTLQSFTTFMNELLESKMSLEGANPPSEPNSVFITTIHKSKGLEFPIVFLPNLEKEFNLKDTTSSLLLDLDYLIGFSIYNKEENKMNSTLILELLKQYKRKKTEEEELRILYVALTRAKEKLILSASVPDLEKKLNKIASLTTGEKLDTGYLLGSKSYLDWILPVLFKGQSSNSLTDRAEILPVFFRDRHDCQIRIHNTDDIESIKAKVFTEIKTYGTGLLYETIDTKDPIEETVSVTSLAKEKTKKIPNFLIQSNSLAVGTQYHLALEHLLFKEYSEKEFTEEFNQFLGHMGPSVSISAPKIWTFFNSDLYRDVILKSNIRKEQPIRFLEGEVLVEGIVDLLCETKDTIYIIDYKSDQETEEQLIKRYQKQLQLYESSLKTSKKVEKYIYALQLGKFIKIT